jgi:hypothetical protein
MEQLIQELCMTLTKSPAVKDKAAIYLDSIAFQAQEAGILTKDGIKQDLRYACEIAQRYPNIVLKVLHKIDQAMETYWERKKKKLLYVGSLEGLNKEEKELVEAGHTLVPNGLQSRIEQYLLGIDNKGGRPGTRKGSYGRDSNPWQDNAIRAMEDSR